MCPRQRKIIGERYWKRERESERDKKNKEIMLNKERDTEEIEVK